MPRSPIYIIADNSDSTITPTGNSKGLADYIEAWSSLLLARSRKQTEPESIEHSGIIGSKRCRLSSALHRSAGPLGNEGLGNIKDRRVKKRCSVRSAEVGIPERLFPAFSYGGFESLLP